MLKVTLTALAVVMLAGCASPKTMQATGGSKSDGTVEMSYEYGPFESPQVNTAQGVKAAEQRCQAWGYSSAEAFGGGLSQCVNPGGGMCNLTRVTHTYQCLD
ncbi:YecR family lipoprotein [Vreelandella profundi]|uniref:YecR family lipoprotein n=1 Tax=Vreelandella profundi TaxID=2852117 RepID=UPI001F187221|nr:YecR family lipoprotein [Halomonas profundi]